MCGGPGNGLFEKHAGVEEAGGVEEQHILVAGEGHKLAQKAVGHIPEIDEGDLGIALQQQRGDAGAVGVPENHQFPVGLGQGALDGQNGLGAAGKDVVVVGGGDSAATEALTLSRICRTVTLLHRGASMSASAPMKAKLRESSVRVLGHTEVIDVLGEEFVTGVKVRRQTTNETYILVASAMFVAIGRKPATDIFKHEIQVAKHGYFVPIGRPTCTNVPGVFVAGDCADHVYRQAITSAGSGCQAALDAEHYLG